MLLNENSNYLRLIRETESVSKEDYLKLKEDIFKDMSLEEIYDHAKEHWELQNEKS